MAMADGFHPAQPPHPCASAARALAFAADFSFSFLPSRWCCRWTVQDMRDGRVLLNGTLEFEAAIEGRPVFTELVVCDPLHRRYILLPPVPDDLTASLKNLDPTLRMYRCKPFLLPLDEEEIVPSEDTAFRVIWMAHCKTKLFALVYSSSTGQWRAATSKACSDLDVPAATSNRMSKIPPSFLKRHYAYGCFYWNPFLVKSKKLLLLDTRRMEFSMADLPPGEWSTRGLAIVEAGEGRLGMFGFRGETATDLSYIVARNKGESPSQWQMEKTISLDPWYKYDIKDATERYLLLTREEDSYPRIQFIGYFSVDIKTSKLQRVCAKQDKRIRDMHDKHIYANYPPSLLSSPTI